MRLKLQKVIWLIFIFLFVLVFNFTWLYKKIYKIEINGNANQLFSYLVPMSSYLIKNKHLITSEEIDKALKRISDLLHIRLTFIDPSGKILGDSWKQLSAMDIIADTKEFKDALKKGKGVSIRYDRTTDKYMLCVARPIYINNRLAGVIVASKPVDEINFLMLKIKKYFFYTATFWWLFFVLLLMVFYYITTSDLKSMFNSIFEMFKQKEEPSILEKNHIFVQFSNIVEEMKKISKELYDLRKVIDILSNTQYCGVAITDADGSILKYNRKFKNLFERSQIELTRLNIKDIFRNFEFNRAFQRSQKENIFVETEVELFIDERFYPFKVKVSPFYNNNDKKVLIELFDLSRIKRLESFERELLTNINHELKTPLSIIKGFIEALNEEVMSDRFDVQQIKRFIEKIYKHTLRMEEVLNTVLILTEDASRVEKAIKKARIDLVRLVEEVLESFSILAENSNIQIKRDVPEGAVYITANATLIRQAMGNLLENAIKFSPSGSKVVVGLIKEKDRIEFYVKDSGIGIPPEYHDKVFEKFFKIRSSYKREGSGLGLYITKRIVELHGATITLESTPNQGSRFAIVFDNA